MTKRITELTAEQKAMLPVWRAKWIAIGLSTEPADRPRAEAAYRACYRAANLSDSVPIVWVSSPIVGAFAAAIASSILRKKPARSAVGSAEYSEVDSEARSAVGSAVHSEVGSAVGSAVGLEEYSEVDSKVGSAVSSVVYSAVGSVVYSVVYSAVGSAPPNNIKWHPWLGGQMWSAWPARESYFRECCGLILDGDLSERACAFTEASEAACYWWPNANFIIASDRPAEINRDDLGRLHCATGPAIVWRDGWGIHSWHGVTVPREWIEDPKSLSATAALAETNTERRRAACEILGWPKVMDELGAKVIDRDTDPEIGELLSADLPEAPGSRFLRVQCGTGRQFVLPVPPEVQTALEANAWTYDIPVNLLETKEFRT